VFGCSAASLFTAQLRRRVGLYRPVRVNRVAADGLLTMIMANPFGLYWWHCVVVIAVVGQSLAGAPGPLHFRVPALFVYRAHRAPLVGQGVGRGRAVALRGEVDVEDPERIAGSVAVGLEQPGVVRGRQGNGNIGLSSNASVRVPRPWIGVPLNGAMTRSAPRWASHCSATVSSSATCGSASRSAVK
jgi:hypothetical protein